MYSQPFDPDKAAVEAGFEPVTVDVEILSEEDQEQFDRETQGWGDHPIKRAVFLAALFLGAGGLGALAFMLPRTATQQAEEVGGSDAIVTALQKQLKNLEAENAQYRADLALANQGAFQDNPASDKDKAEGSQKAPGAADVTAHPPEFSASPQPQPSSEPVKVKVPSAGVKPVAPVSPAAPPPARVVQPVAALIPKPLPTPALAPVLPRPALTPLKIAPTSSAPKPLPVNPEAVLAQLEPLGSYGNGATDPASPVATLTPPAVPQLQPVSHGGQPPAVVAGSTAMATLDIPVVWTAEDLNRDPAVVVTLSQSLGALPPGSQLTGVARLDPTTGSALLLLEGVLQDGWEQPLPEGAVMALAQEDIPLRVKPYPDPNEITASPNLESKLLRGLTRGVARELSQGIENDLVSRVVDEGVNELLGNAEQPPPRSESQSSVAWTLAQGTRVKLIVNHSFSLGETAPSWVPAHNPLPAASPALLGANTTTPLPVEGGSFDPAPALVPTPPAPPPATQFIADATLVTLSPGLGANISFLDSGEQITRAWLDDPSFATLHFDQPLCAAQAQSCTSGHPSVVHLRLLEGLEFEHLPSGDSTLLTVMTQTLQGEERLHVFRLERAAGDTNYHTVEVAPSQPSRPPVTHPSEPWEAITASHDVQTTSFEPELEPLEPLDWSATASELDSLPQRGLEDETRSLFPMDATTAPGLAGVGDDWVQPSAETACFSPEASERCLPVS